MIEHVYAVKRLFKQENIFFCVSGPVSQNLVADIATLIEQKMMIEQTGKRKMLRVFAVVVEKLQNIMRYSEEKISSPSAAEHEQELSVGLVEIGYEGENLFVLSGNLMKTDNVEPLRAQLSRVQTMTKEELRQYANQKRKAPLPEGSKGAGLGLIEIAKKSSRPIEFEFEPVDDRLSFFILKTVI